MENTVDFSGLTLIELNPDTAEAPVTQPESGASVVPETTVEDTPAPETDDEDDDTPWGSDDTVVDDPNAGDEDTEEFAKLEASEKWRVKRLNKEIEAKKAAEAEAAALKAELEALKSGKEKPAETEDKAPRFDAQEFEQVLREHDPYIKALHERIELVKSNKDKFETMADYADALTELTAEYKSEIKDRKREYNEHQRAQASTVQQTETKIVNDFYSAIDSLKEVYPQIEKARDVINANADKLHVDIRRALLLDEHKGELAWAIGSSKKNLQYLIEESAIAARTGQTPIGALKLLGKMSDEVGTVKKPASVAAPQAPVQRTKPAGVPKTMKARAPNGTYEDMDPYTWATKVARGEIKNTLF